MSCVSILNEWSSLVKRPALLHVTYDTTGAGVSFVTTSKISLGRTHADTVEVQVTGPERANKAASKEASARALLAELSADSPAVTAWTAPPGLREALWGVALDKDAPLHIRSAATELRDALLDVREPSAAAIIADILPMTARVNLVSAVSTLAISTKDD